VNRRNGAEEALMLSKLLPRNEHPMDRLLRAALGIALISLAFIGPRTAWGFVGLVPLLTALAGSCPLYTLFGISTCPTRKRLA
jgi:hypothetical protein